MARTSPRLKQAIAKTIGFAAVVFIVNFVQPQALAQTVTPIDWSQFSSPALNPTQQDIKYFINKSAGYNLNHIEQTIPTIADSATPSGRRYDMQTGTESEIRQISHIVDSTAGMLKTGAFDSSLTGFNETTFLNRSIEMIQGASLEHISNGTGVKWGNSWQSALWTAQLAEGAWMIWDKLPATTRTYVTNMTMYEANRFVNYNVPYWANPDGTLNSPGDTKAEENAWNSRMLSVAVAMMPNNANSQLWRAKASELMVSSFARPSDLTNTTVLDGTSVANWLHGYNAYQSGFVENHGIIHDDYMTTTGLIVAPFVTQSLARQAVPQAAAFNAAVVYDAMASVPVGSQQKTMFQRGPQGQYIPDVYYPQGTDWSLYRYDIFTEMDAYADLFGFDAHKPYDAMGWERARLDRVLQMQSRHTDGHLYDPGEFDSWPTKEASALQLLTDVWMINWLNGQDAIERQGNWTASLTPPKDGHLRLVIDRATGDITAINSSNVSTAVLDGYAISSQSGQLSTSTWLKLSQQGFGSWLAAHPSANLLSELKTSGAITVAPGQSISLGRVFVPVAPTAIGGSVPGDIQFQFTGSGQVFDGDVQYSGVSRNGTLTLVIDPVTGRTLLRNDTSFAPTIEAYLITSVSGALHTANADWHSLHDQGIDAGAWFEANPSTRQIAELNANGGRTFGPTSVFDLGKMFNPMGLSDLVFQFLLAGQTQPLLGSVIYESIGIDGDYDHDGIVNAADYVVWRKSLGTIVTPGIGADGNFDGQVNQLDYAVWRSHFGESLPTLANANGANVPEPSAIASVISCLSTLLSLTRKRPQ